MYICVCTVIVLYCTVITCVIEIQNEGGVEISREREREATEGRRVRDSERGSERGREILIGHLL